MKKLLLILAFAINFVSAQNVEYLKQANNSDADFTRKFSDDLAKSATIKYVYFDEFIHNSGTTLSIVYVPEGTTKEQKETIKADIVNSSTATNFESNGNLCVHFTIIKETKRYQFEYVQSKFLDLFQFWKTNVDPLADETKINQKGISAIRNNEKGFWYNLSRKSNSKTWLLKNYTYRINE